MATPVLVFSPVGKCSVCGKRANYSLDGVRFCGEKCEEKSNKGVDTPPRNP